MTVLGTETAMKHTNKMRYQLLVLLVCWLWNATSSKADDCIRTFQCQSRTDDDFLCEQGHNVSINATCGHKSGDISKCNISITNVPFCDQHHSTSMPTTEKPTTPAECKCTSTSVSENSVSEATAVVTNTGCSTSNFSNLTIALGALVGLLLVLLVVVTTGWVWTCWLMRVKRRNSNQTRSNNIIEMSDNIIISQINPCYNQPTLPVYESIPSHPKQNNKREEGKQGENSYDTLNQEQLGTVLDSEIIREEAKMFNYSKLELADNQIKPVKNPAYATTT